MGSAVNDFPVLYDKLDHIIMAAKLIDKMLPPAARNKKDENLFTPQRFQEKKKTLLVVQKPKFFKQRMKVN